MIVNDPGNLHERVNRCRANTLEPSAHQVLAYGFSFWCLCRYLASIAEAVRDGFVVHKAPTVVTEWSEFLNHLQVKHFWKFNLIILTNNTEFMQHLIVNCKSCAYKKEAHLSHCSDSQRVQDLAHANEVSSYWAFSLLMGRKMTRVSLIVKEV